MYFALGPNYSNSCAVPLDGPVSVLRPLQVWWLKSRGSPHSEQKNCSSKIVEGMQWGKVCIAWKGSDSINVKGMEEKLENIQGTGLAACLSNLQ